MRVVAVYGFGVCDRCGELYVKYTKHERRWCSVECRDLESLKRFHDKPEIKAKRNARARLRALTPDALARKTWRQRLRRMRAKKEGDMKQKLLTDEERLEGARLRERGVSWRDIGNYFKVTEYTARCSIDLEFRSRRERRQQELRADTERERPTRKTSPDLMADPLYNPKRDGEPRWESDSAQYFGEPPLGRRELLKQRG